MGKLIKVDFSKRAKDLRDMNKVRKEEKHELKIDRRIERAVANSRD